ncbi:PREDICTED: uncharacterized protein LOC109190620 [Ipomoea nil]|uniref:uncharacterized protein LOC109190620 n=1 Tax=Ipomoea nil TaxID=35883 RepID=UPI000901E9F0|nr:PREDICTED: uncharacterized protein LOC109190620 [Ipomoea nil]
MEAECWGIYTGMEKAWEMGFRKLVIESDCAKATSILNNCNDYGGPASNLIEKCREAKRRHWEVAFIYAPREKNKVADILAKKAHEHNEAFRWFEHPPGTALEALREDELGLLGGTNIVRISY